ncbi:MAG: hypothetical protein E6G66_19225 [Actinobacteria bacterium]|nr:MAG: hypothetical protein E6G66_19225 [Actinomycetota bacterium]
MNDAEHSILVLARSQHGAISRQQALQHGMSAKAIDHRLASGEWGSLFKGAYFLGGTQRSWEQKAIGAVLAAGDGSVASYRAAGALLGFPGVPRWVEVTVLRPRQVRIDGVIAHRARSLPPEDVRVVSGIPATAPGRTIADLALIYPKTKMDPIFNYATANRLVTRAEMEGRATGRSHDDVLRQLLDERPATPRPMGSEFEAGLFGVLRNAGLPLPVPQYRVLMGDGSAVFLDFAYPEVCLAIEADSYLWHASLPPADMARRVRGALETRRAG